MPLKSRVCNCGFVQYKYHTNAGSIRGIFLSRIKDLLRSNDIGDREECSAMKEGPTRLDGGQQRVWILARVKYFPPPTLRENYLSKLESKSS